MRTLRDNLLKACSALCTLILITTGSASAVSQNDLNSIVSNTPFYDPTATQCSTSPGASTASDVTVTGNNVMDAMTTLVDNGYSPQQAAGITGNLMWESDGSGGDIVPTAQTPGNPAYGIAQWQGDRLTEMRAWVTAKGEDPTSFQGQMDYLLYELTTSEIGAANAVKATTTVHAAADAFEQNYERAGDPVLPNREADADAAYAKYSGGGGATATTASSSTGATCGCSGSATPTSGSAASTTIVLDPGHATQANEQVDPATQLPVFDYSNPIEQQQVWDMSQDLATKLKALGYTVLNTKTSEDDTNTNLEQRAEVGNSAGAALGVSLHTTPGSPTVGNDVFYPGVGNYVTTVNGQNDVYTNQTLSATDQADAQKMAADLTAAEPGVTFRAGTYADLYGTITRQQNGITMAGNMLTTQYFATVPWVYVEQYQDAGNGTTSQQAMQDYENGVLKGIEDIVPPPNGGGTGTATASTGSCAPVSCSAGTNVTGDAKILCEAEQYNGIYYLWGGGHDGYSAFTSACTPAVLATAAQKSTTADPGPCATDCSGLVSMALDQAFGLDYDWTVAGSMQGAGSQYWQQIPISQAQAGDIVTTPEHVEIVDHVQGSTVYTFGSHYTGSKTSAVTSTASDWPSGAWHWTGPGSS